MATSTASTSTTTLTTTTGTTPTIKTTPAHVPYTATALTQADLDFINAGKDDNEKARRRSLLTWIIDVNGSAEEGGIAKSYIPPDNYYQKVGYEVDNPIIKELHFMALNWSACGRGNGGLAAAAVRRAFASSFVDTRETKIHTVPPKDIDVLVDEFIAFAGSKQEVLSFWQANAINVVGLAAVVFYKEVHHWNAQNTRPQDALLGALERTDEIRDADKRKLFYLSIHPLPLKVLAQVRSDILSGAAQGVNDTVAIRMRGAPAGYGDVHAASAAVADLRGEAFADPIVKKFGNRLADLTDAATTLEAEATDYHIYANKLGGTKKVLDKTHYKTAMIIMVAYIQTCVKGTLANAASLKKFANQNARSVQKWKTAFETAVENQGETLDALCA